MKALREDKLNTAERFVVTRPGSRSAKSTSTSLQARQTAAKSDCNCQESVKCQHDRQNRQLLRA
ncbi:hypothetical protein QUA56_35450 [Microcoleus sp. N3A4]|uniref:hypothetical protein n=1 Tax=Microcoleus sp. N3A4 TaxID=3055379 RepID=UPI002FD6BC5D